MSGTSPLRVVVAGGGIAGLEALLALRELASDLVSLTLVEPRSELVLRALEPAEPFAAGAAGRLAIDDVAEAAGASVVRSPLERVDADARCIQTRDGRRIDYDALVIAVGSTPAVAYRHAITWWPYGGHRDFEAVLTELEDLRAQRVAFVVPARCSWPLPAYELALMTARRLERRERGGAELRLITPEPAPLAIFGPGGSAAVAHELDDAGIAFTGDAVVAMRDEAGMVEVWPSDQRLPVDRVVALPHAVGPEVPGLRADIEGFLATDEHGAVRGVSRVWAAGDATDGRPMQGGLAARQADCAARQIARLAGAHLPEASYTPLLRAQLRTGRASLWLQRDISDPLDAGVASRPPIWSPPGKIAAPRLGALLAARDVPAGLRVAPRARRFAPVR